MRTEIRAADERWEVLAAATAWRAAGALDDGELAAIRARYPDDRRRSRAGFRLLFFLFTILAGVALWGFVATLFGFALFGAWRAVPHLLLLAALATGAAWSADVAVHRHRLRGFGVEEGLMALALGWGMGAIAIAVEEVGLSGRPALFVVAGLVAVLASAALWRWAAPLTGAAAAAALFVAFGALSSARALWIVSGAALSLLAWRFAADPRQAPAHRRRADEVFVVATLALYAAVHVAGLASDGLGWLTRGSGVTHEAAPAWRALAWAAMTALPMALLALGLRRRDRLALSLGALLGLATAASATDALDLEPAWLVLSVAGAGLIGMALALRWRFARAPERRLGGFTDRPLFEPDGGRSFLELAATLAALSPAPRAPEPEPGLRGGGGEFGGGGASGKF